jgi:hypothetical protein
LRTPSVSIGLVGVFDPGTVALREHPPNRLAEPDPRARVRLLAHEVVALRRQAHGQDEVGVARGLVPGGRERGVQADPLLVAEHLDPRRAVRIGPDRIEDAREVDVETLLLRDEVGQQRAHLVVGERVFARVEQLVPDVLRRRLHERLRHELVPAVRRGAALGADRSGEHDQELERAGDLPAAEIAGGGAPPDMAGERALRGADDLGRLEQLETRDGALLLRALEGVCLQVRLQGLEESLEPRDPGPQVAQRLVPVGVLAQKLRVDLARLEEVARDRKQDRRLRAGPCGQPQVRLRRRVGEARVHDDEPRALLPALDDALRVRVEVVAGLEVRREQQDGLGPGEVGRRPVGAHHERVADARRAGADVGVAVVAVDAPRLQDAIHHAVVARPPDVVHDLGAPVLLERLADARGQRREHPVPRNALPLAAAAGAHPLEGKEDAVAVLDLVERRGSLRADPSAAAGMDRIALEAADLAGRLVDVGQEPARRFAVEADRRHQTHPALDLSRPRLRVVLDPVVPPLRRRRGGHLIGNVLHDSGTSWPALT